MKRALGFLCAVIAVSAGGCSNNPQPSVANSAGSAPPNTSVPATTTTTAGPTYSATATYTGKDPTQGYTAVFTIRWGPLRHATSQDISESGTTGSCVLNGQADAVVPFQLQMSNTTAGFNLSNAGEQVLFQAQYGSSALSNLDFSAVESVQGSMECEEQQRGAEASVYANSLPPNASVSTTGFFIVPGYYSPANPSGNASEYDVLTLRMNPLGLQWDMTSSSSGFLPYAPLRIPLIPGVTPPCAAVIGIDNCPT